MNNGVCVFSNHFYATYHQTEGLFSALSSLITSPVHPAMTQLQAERLRSLIALVPHHFTFTIETRAKKKKVDAL